MIYGGLISTPANTAEATPKWSEYAISGGIFYHLKVIFPPGPSGLLKVQIFDATYQVFPTTPDAYFEGDNLRLDFDVLYPKDAAPFVFLVKTWNLDDTYAHTVQVLLSMESAEEFKARYLPMIGSSAITDGMAEQEVAKETARRDRLQKFLDTIPEGE